MKIEKQSIYHEKEELSKRIKKKELKEKLKFQRRFVIGSLLSLFLLSLANMISTSFYRAMSTANVSPKKHLIWMILGGMALVTTSKVPYKVWKNKKINRSILVIIVLVFIFMLFAGKFAKEIVPTINGGTSWIRIKSITIQPAEFAKVGYIILLAHLLEGTRRMRCSTKETLLSVGVLGGLIIGLLYIGQGDLGTSLHYIFITGVMLLVSPVSNKVIGWIAVGGMTALSIMIKLVYTYSSSNDYIIKRIKSYVDILFKGELSDMGVGYQVNQSLIAIGSGGIMGKGYGNGIQKYNYLPEIHTDFISSSLGEEWGILVMFFIILAFLQILKVAMNTSSLIEDYFGKYLIIGVASLIFTQMLINLYVATGLMPVTGLPLPIFSYGGSSMLTICIALGIFFNINDNAIKDKYS